MQNILSKDRQHLATQVRQSLFRLCSVQYLSPDSHQIIKQCQSIAYQIGDAALSNLVHVHEALFALYQDDPSLAKRHLLVGLELADKLCDASAGEKNITDPSTNNSKSIIDTSNWASFQDSFGLRWPNFSSNLSSINDQLSRSEIKVCMLISTGRGNKEIAKFLGISAKTVENHRGKIRVKLRLIRGQDLESFLHKLSRTDGGPRRELVPGNEREGIFNRY